MKAAIARAKDLEVARLWASQKKLVDRASELDELRARRCALFDPLSSHPLATQPRQTTRCGDVLNLKMLHNSMHAIASCRMHQGHVCRRQQHVHHLPLRRHCNALQASRPAI